MILLDGKKLSAEIKEDLKKKIQEEKEASGRQPGLGILQVGQNAAAKVYVNSQIRGSKAMGIEAELCTFPEEATEEEVLAKIAEWNQAEHIDGIIIQFPLPERMSATRVIEAILPSKDVDGVTAGNMGRLFLGKEGFTPCTPTGIMRLLEEYGISTKGKHACVIGRSNIVGKPMAGLFLKGDATVTLCHSHTEGLKNYTKKADILVVAVGKAGFLKAEDIQEGAVVVDVGINRGNDGKLVGDVDFEGIAQKAAYLTPVPGGVGSMTVAMLFQNIWKAFVKNRRIVDGQKNKGK